MDSVVHLHGSQHKGASVLGLVLLAVAGLSFAFSGVMPSIAFMLAAAMCWSKPFEDNRAKGKPAPSDRARVFLAIGLTLLGVLLLSRSGDRPVAGEAATAAVQGGAPCGGNGRATMMDFAVQTTTALRSRPDKHSDLVSMPFGADQTARPVSIDHTMPVRELCRSGDWSEVRVLMLPSDIGRAEGWVPTAVLRPVKTGRNGRRIYNAADLEFSDGSHRYEAATLAVINRVMEQDPKCDAINTLILVDKDSTGARLHFSCFGEPERSIDFSSADASNGRDFTPAQPVEAIKGADAILKCEDAARERLSHPSTADFAMLDVDFKSFDNGAATYSTTVTARNGFNLELKYQVVCEFTGSELTDIKMDEAR